MWTFIELIRRQLADCGNWLGSNSNSLSQDERALSFNCLAHSLGCKAALSFARSGRDDGKLDSLVLFKPVSETSEFKFDPDFYCSHASFLLKVPELVVVNEGDSAAWRVKYLVSQGECMLCGELLLVFWRYSARLPGVRGPLQRVYHQLLRGQLPN